MGKKNTAQARRDPKGRILRPGEYYEETKNRYKYRYRAPDGKYHDVYAFRLTDKDPVPYDKPERYRTALRELERQIEEDIRKGIDSSAGNMTVLELANRYTSHRTNPRNPRRVKETTAAGYKTIIKFLKSDPIGARRIKDIRMIDARTWFTDLQYDRIQARETDETSKAGKGYSQLASLKGFLKPAFQFARENGWAEGNPFDFNMDVLIDDSEKRDAISPKDMRRFLNFVWSSRNYHRYFDMIYILFNTGMRVSEFCGLTLDDIDLDRKVIHIRRELLYKSHIGLYIETPKTESGCRDIPMIPGVEKAFASILVHRPVLNPEPTVWDRDHKHKVSGFLTFTREGTPQMETNIAARNEPVQRDL